MYKITNTSTIQDFMDLLYFPAKVWIDFTNICSVSSIDGTLANGGKCIISNLFPCFLLQRSIPTPFLNSNYFCK